MSRQRKLQQVILLLALVGGLDAAAETTVIQSYDPFAAAILKSLGNSSIGGTPGSTSPSSGGDSSSLAKSVTDATVSKAQPQLNSEDGSRSREYNAGDAQNMANSGAQQAMLTGAALMASAIPMLASILPPVRAAGAMLMSEAGLEFAQAAASKNTADKNGDQKNMLTNQNGDGATSQANGTDTTPTVSPDLANLLSSRGVNPDAFMSDLASGKLSDPSTLLRAAGDTNDYSPEDLQKGAELAQQNGATVTASVDHPDTSSQLKTISYDPSAPTGSNVGGVAAPGSDPLGRGLASNDGMQDGGLSGGALATDADGRPIGKGGLLGPGGAGAASGGSAATASAEAAKLDAFHKLLGGALTPAEAAAVQKGKLAQLTNARLKHLGLQKLNPAQNIFQTAHRHFRSIVKEHRQSSLATLWH